MNQGLKEYTKQLSYEVGEVANCYVNVKKGAENLHIVIPLVETVGPAAITLGLVYNYQDRTKNYGFGNGMRLTYQNELVLKTNSIEVTQADGSTDVYEYVSAKGKYINKETGNQISRRAEYVPYEDDEIYYDLVDSQGNKLTYREDHLSYPNELKFNDGKQIYYQDFQVRNDFGVKVAYSKEADIIKQISYLLKYNNNVEQEMLKIELGYTTNGDLNIVKWYRNTTLIRSLAITYSSTSILVSDDIRKEGVSFSISNGQIVSCHRSYNSSADLNSKVQISYENNKTKITQNDETRVIYFAQNDSFSFEVDSKGNLAKTEWDTNLKKPTFTTGVLTPKDEIYPIDPSSFSIIDGQIRVEQSNLTDPDVSKFLWDLYRFTGTGKLKYTLTTNACEIDDVISIITWGAQLNGGTVEVNVFGDVSQRKTKFHKTATDGKYEPIILGAKVTKNKPSITIEITLTNADIVLNEFDIYKTNAGTYYTYDEEGKLIYTESGINGIERTYNEDGTLAGQEGTRTYRYEYDDKKYLIRSINQYGLVTQNTYTSNGTLMKQATINAKKTRVFETRQTSTGKEHNIATVTDENNDTTYFTYDFFERLSIITDALGNTTNYDYFDTNELKRIIVKNEEIASYTYDSRHNLASVKIGDTIYSFTYNTKNNITGIKLNNQLLYQYEYDAKDRIIKQYNGSLNNPYTFEYNDKDLIEKITFGNEITEFTYDNQDRVTKVKMGNYEKNYTYDTKGNVIKTTDDGAEVEYRYASSNEMNHSLKKVSNKEFHEYYFSLNKSQKSHPLESKLLSQSNYVAGVFRENTSLKNKEYSVPSFKINGVYPTLGYDKLVPYVFAGSDTPLVYALTMPSYGEPCGCIGYWFKPTLLTSKKYLFSVQSDNQTSRIDAYITTSKQVVLEITEVSGTKHTVFITSNYVKLDEWNFFGLSFYNRSDEGSAGISEYLLVLNHKKYIYRKNGSYFKVGVGSNPTYYVGCRISGSQTSLGLSSKITALMIGTRKHVTIEQMEDYYKLTKPLIKETISLNDTEEADYSLTTALLPSTIRDQFDIFPLGANGDSLNGTKPSVFEGRTAYLVGASKTFTLDRKIKRYAFEADGTRLEYQFPASSSRTILCRACIDEDEDKNTIFDCKDNYGNRITLYRNSNSKLYVSINNIEKSTSLNMSSNSYHTVGISFQEAGSGDSLASANVNVRVYLDGSSYVVTGDRSSTLGTLTVSVGKMFTSGTTYTLGVLAETYPLYGHIEMLATRAAYCELTTLNELSNYMKVPTRVKSFDDMGLLRSIEQKNGETTLLKSTQTYRTRAYTSDDTIQSLHYTRQVAKEQITYGSNTANRSYDYYANGNIKTITDDTFGSHSYEYNERGFLTKEDSTKYEYDKNGNITDMGSVHFAYDDTFKDRLKSVNGKEITYGTNPLNPASWNGSSYTFEGRRLTKYAYGGGYYSFEYNAQGLRTAKKDYRGLGSKYYYDGDMLITEISQNYRLDFLYDENNLLYGFIYNNTDKYYYIRDILQNILGIVDINGNLVVKYSYTAYGKITSTTGSQASTIGAYNPFRYKGYYYDSETNMYYCKSRYYVPEWCRWLNADSIDNLDFNDINNMNLFAYCGNNPVMNVDSDGNFAISTIILLICIGVGALVGGTYAGVTAYNDGVRGWELVGWTALGALVGGVVGGLVGYYAGPLVASLFSSGGGFAFAGGLGFAGVAATTGTMVGTLVTAGAIGMTTVGAFAASGVIMFAKGSGARMGHNQYENKQINSLCNKYHLTKEQRRTLHEYISGQNYTYHEIEQIIIELFFS